MSGPAQEPSAPEPSAPEPPARKPARQATGAGARRARRRASHPEIIYGRIAKIEASFAREVRVPPLVLLAVLTAGLPTRLLGLLLRSTGPGAGAAGAGWRALRKGPEFLVTPVLVYDAADQLVPLEIHGHMSESALVHTDRIRARVRWPRDRDLPPQAVRIENLTTGRTLTPRGATLGSHLGLGLVLQAVLGLILITTVVVLMLNG
jgi:hypothetical protein